MLSYADKTIGKTVPGTGMANRSRLITTGKVRRAYLGIAGTSRPLSHSLIRFHNLPNKHAVEVISVEKGGPAEASGLKERNLTISINNTDVAGVDNLHRFLTKWPIGTGVKITVVRGMERDEVEVAPDEAIASVT